jgi:hypothetical protein
MLAIAQERIELMYFVKIKNVAPFSLKVNVNGTSIKSTVRAIN